MSESVDNFNDILNRSLESVVLSDDQGKVTFRFQDGGERAYGVEGDCCSSSWIAHLEAPNDLRGAVILNVEESDAAPWDNHECVQYDYDKSEEENKAAGYCGHDVLAVYNTRFHTNKGTIVLEYRNDSNGYYGGYLVNAS